MPSNTCVYALGSSSTSNSGAKTRLLSTLENVHLHLHCISTGYQFRICFRYQLGLNRSLQLQVVASIATTFCGCRTLFHPTTRAQACLPLVSVTLGLCPLSLVAVGIFTTVTVALSNSNLPATRPWVAGISTPPRLWCALRDTVQDLFRL